MPYGTNPFEDRYGDFKQPAVVDFDQSTAVVNTTILSEKDKEKIVEQFRTDQENTLKEVLAINPYYAGDLYKHLVCAIDGKLAWDLVKIQALKEDITWLYNISRYLNKNKKHLLIRK